MRMYRCYDESLIKDLQLQCLPDCNIYSFKGAEWWVGEIYGKIAAFCGICPSRQWSNTTYLCRAGVLPDFRGKGLQKQLIRVRCRWAKAHGYSFVVTDTRQNPASANNLIACGFKMFTPSNPWGYSDACYWFKELKRKK